MKLQSLIFLFCLAIFSFFGCEGTPEEKNEKIDKTADSAKELIDILKEKTKEIAIDEELQGKFKNLLEDVKMESKDLEKLIKEHGEEWKEKLEEISNDPKMREKLKNLEGDSDEIKKKLEEIIDEVSKKNN
jgi:uncharacterized protein Yka (UPF0111/DUF47 family)